MTASANSAAEMSSERFMGESRLGGVDGQFDVFRGLNRDVVEFHLEVNFALVVANRCVTRRVCSSWIKL